MTMKKLYMLLAVVLLMFIMGCTPGGWGNNSPSSTGSWDSSKWDDAKWAP